MSYEISVYIDELQAAVSLDFKCLSDEYRITKICRLQCIGWMLDTVEKVEEQLQLGCTWTNPEDTIESMERLAGIPKQLARKIIAANNRNEKFDLVWNYISDEEKNLAITVDFNASHNFWPGFQLFCHAIIVHLANTNETEDLQSKIRFFENNSKTSPSPLPNSSTPEITDNPISYIEIDMQCGSRGFRKVVYDTAQPPQN
ncbi:hypothetical protein [Pseudomonas sp. LB3P14]